MNDQKEPASPEVGVWERHPGVLRVEYDHNLLEQIRRVVQEGFHKIPHGGIETGGILYGKRESGSQGGTRVSISAWRPMPCSHQNGPKFELSNADQLSLSSQLAQAEVELAGLEPVGWFASHSRSDLTLRPADVALQGRFFSEPSHLILLLCAHKNQITEAVFLSRAEGTLSVGASEAPFELVPRVLPRPEKKPRPRADASEVAPAELPPTAVDLADDITGDYARDAALPRFLAEAAPARSHWPRRFGWAAAWLFAALGGVYAIQRVTPETPPLHLEISELGDPSDGQLLVRWNLNSRGSARIGNGTLEMIDGGHRFSYKLDEIELRKGSFTFLRDSRDVEARLELSAPGETPLHVAAKFHTDAAVDNSPGTAEAKKLAASLDEARREGERLRAQVDAQGSIAK